MKISVNDLYKYIKLQNVPLLGSANYDFWTPYTSGFTNFDRYFRNRFKSWLYFESFADGESSEDMHTDFTETIAAHLAINSKRYSELYRVQILENDAYDIVNNYDLHETLSDYGTNADLARTNLVRKYLEWSEPFEHPWYGTLIPLGLDADTLTKIYRGNFIRRLGAPRPVNASLTAETAKAMREAMADGTMCCETEERTALEYQNLDIIENYFKNSEE